MLHLMREWFHHLKILLLLVVVSFVLAIFWDWGGARDAARAGADATWAARVDGDEIPASVFMQRARFLDATYRQMYGQGYEQQRASLQLSNTVIRDLINNRLVFQEARRLGLLPTLDDLSLYITRMPEFQGTDGSFIGRQRYQDLLRKNGLEVAGFEHEQHEAMAVDRFKNAIFNSVSVSPQELDEELRRRNETSRVALLRLPLSRFSSSAAPSLADLQAHLARVPERFRRAETRRGRFLILSREKVSTEVKVAEEEVRRQYESELSTRFTRSEQRRASHILFKLDAAAAAADIDKVRRKAEGVLAKARSGADFAALARSHSEDPGSASAGGDLGFFGRGAMVAEFENEAFALPVGELSNLVRSSFGFHIIKVTGEQPAGTIPFEEARQNLERTLVFQRAQEEMTRRARTWTERARAGDTLEEVAAQDKVEVQDTGLIPRDSRGGGATAGIVQALFALGVDDVSEPLAVPEGLAVVQLFEIQAATVPPLDEVRAQLEADWSRERTLEQARSVLESAGVYAAAPPAPAAAAKNLNGSLAEAGPFLQADASPASSAVPSGLRPAAFSTPVGAWSRPAVDGEDLVLLHVLERTTPPEAVSAPARDNLRRTLLYQKRNLLYSQILEKLRERTDVEINQPLINQIEGV